MGVIFIDVTGDTRQSDEKTGDCLATVCTLTRLWHLVLAPVVRQLPLELPGDGPDLVSGECKCALANISKKTIQNTQKQTNKIWTVDHHSAMTLVCRYVSVSV